MPVYDVRVRSRAEATIPVMAENPDEAAEVALNTFLEKIEIDDYEEEIVGGVHLAGPRDPE